MDRNLNPALARRLRKIRDDKTQGKHEKLMEAGASHLTEVFLGAAKAIPKRARQPGVPTHWNVPCQQAEDHCLRCYENYLDDPSDILWGRYVDAKALRADTMAAKRRRLFD